jgi:hypothetical protein
MLCVNDSLLAHWYFKDFGSLSKVGAGPKMEAARSSVKLLPFVLDS